MTPEYVVCVDTGSTFTKAAAVAVSGADTGRLLATAAVPTTVGRGLDVLTGLDDAVRAWSSTRPAASRSTSGSARPPAVDCASPSSATSGS